MAKTSYPYVIAWHANPGRVDVWTKKGAWGAYFRFDIMKLFRTLSSAESEAFKRGTMGSMVGEIAVYRFDEFLNLKEITLAADEKAFQLRVARKWMRRRPLPKYMERPGDPMTHGHNSVVRVERTPKGGRVYKCSWCNVKVGSRRIPRKDV